MRDTLLSYHFALCLPQRILVFCPRYRPSRQGELSRLASIAESRNVGSLLAKPLFSMQATAFVCSNLQAGNDLNILRVAVSLCLNSACGCLIGSNVTGRGNSILKAQHH